MLQPLNVCLFKPFSCAYLSKLVDFIDKCQGLTSITKRDFFRIFYNAQRSSFKKKIIFKAFKVTGLLSFNPQQVLNRFNIKERGRPLLSKNSILVLSMLDWRKIKQLLHKVVANIYNRLAQQLSQTIHLILVRNNLLQYKNECLQEAFINKKKY